MNVYFDENFSRFLVYALQALEDPYGQISLFSTEDIMKSAPDSDVIQLVANNEGVLFTKDTDFHKQKLIREVIQTNNVGLVYFGIRNQNHWMQVRYIMYNWHLLREKIIKKKKSFAFRIIFDGKGKSKLEKIILRE